VSQSIIQFPTMNLATGETKAVKQLAEDFARAMASTEAVNKLLRTFTDEQRIIYEKTMVEEMRKQGFHT